MSKVTHYFLSRVILWVAWFKSTTMPIIIDRVVVAKQGIFRFCCVCPSVCLSVHLLALSQLNHQVLSKKMAIPRGSPRVLLTAGVLLLWYTCGKGVV